MLPTTDSYFYLAIEITKCMMIADALNYNNYPVRTEITNTKQIPTLHVCSTDESELKEFPVGKTILHVCSTYESKLK